MKKIKSFALLTLSALFVSACQTVSPNNSVDLNSENNLIKTSSIIKSVDIKEIKPSNNTIGNIDSAVVVATLTGGDLDKPLKQKLYFNFESPKNPALGTEITFGNNNISRFADQRHHKNLKGFTREKELAKKAYKEKRVFKKPSSNALLKEGATRTFNVLTDDNGNFKKNDAVLYKISKTACFWIDKSIVDTLDKTAINKSVKYWEEKAFPIVTSKFGPAPMPPNDVDGEARINLFLTPLEKGLYGYFYSVDVIDEGAPETNKTDMLYINSLIFTQGEAKEDDANGTLIHEFQHLVNFNSKVTQRINQKKEPLYEDRWLDEGMSTYAEQLGGYGLPSGDTFSAAYLNKFFEDPSIVPIVTNDGNLNYGTSLLFVLYLTEQYGADAVKKLTASDKTGIENVQLITGKSFEKTFSDWATALLLSGSKNSRFDFKSVDLHKAYGKYNLDGINLKNIIDKFPKKAGYNMYDWTVNYLKLDNLASSQVNMNIKHNGKGSLSANLVKIK